MSTMRWWQLNCAVRGKNARGWQTDRVMRMLVQAADKTDALLRAEPNRRIGDGEFIMGITAVFESDVVVVTAQAKRQG